MSRKSIGMRLFACLIGCGFVAMLAGSAQAASVRPASTPTVSESGRDFNPMIALRYSGSFDAKVFTASGRDSNGNTIPLSPITAHFEWSYTWRGTFDDLYHKATRWQTGSLSGTVAFHDDYPTQSACTNKAGAQVNCGDTTCTFGQKPQTYQLSANVPPAKATIVYSGGKVDWPRTKIGFEQPPPNDVGIPVLLKKTGGNYPCEGGFGTAIMHGSKDYPRLFQEKYAFLIGKGGTKALNVSVPGPSPGSFGRLETVFTMTFGSLPPRPATGGGQPPTGKAPPAKPKPTAQADLKLALQRAKGPCSGLAGLLGQKAGSGPWSASGSGSGLAAGVLQITGDALNATFGSLCAALLKQIVVDYDVVERDPPLGKAAPALALPSCDAWQGTAATYCQQLGAAATKLVAAEGKVLPALKRLRSAGMSLRAARKQGNAKATKAAQAKVNAAAASLRSARAAARAAGKTVAGTVRGAGVQGTLTKAQSQAVIAVLEQRLAKQGLKTADLRKLAPSALKTAPIDLLAALGT